MTQKYPNLDQEDRLLPSSTIAIIGGMGKAAARYFDTILDQCSKATIDQSFPPTVIIQNSSIQDRTQSIKDNNLEPVKGIVNSIHAAERMGIKRAIMTCNTAHFFIEDIKQKIHLELLNIIKITGSFVAQQNIPNKKIGIIATTGTMNSKVYHKELQQYDIQIADISIQEQKDIHNAIYGEYDPQGTPLHNGIKSNPKNYDRNIELIQPTLNRFKKQEIQHVILGCTEFSVIQQELSLKNPHLQWIDPLRCSAQYILENPS